MAPKARAIGIAVLALLLVGAIVWVRQPDARLVIGGPFALVDSAGKPVTDQAFRGKYLLVYFGYTTCPDVCPTTLANVDAALDTLGPQADRVQPLFISIDPARDTPAVIGPYVATFGTRWVGLTGSAEQIAAVAAAYRVYYARHRTGDGPLEYSMDHSSILYMVGPDGRFIAPLAADAPAATLAADLSKHLS